MNLFEFIDATPEEENKQKIIDHFVKTITGRTTGPLMLRKVAKIPIGTNEEMKNATAEIFKISKSQIAHVDIEKEVTKARANFDAVKKLVSTYEGLLKADKKTRHGKFEELYDIGRFLVATGVNFTIATDRLHLKYPDFVILDSDREIGIEHTRLIDPKVKEIISIAKSYLKAAESLISASNPNLTGVVNVYFDYQQPVIGNHSLSSGKIPPDGKAKIPVIISDYIQSVLLGEEAAKPPFIAKLGISNDPESKLSLIFSESYFGKEGFEELLLERIREKDKRYLDYLVESKVKDCWLLITIDGISSFSGFDLNSVPIPDITESNFENVLLFETISGKIIQIFRKQLP